MNPNTSYAFPEALKAIRELRDSFNEMNSRFAQRIIQLEQETPATEPSQTFKTQASALPQSDALAPQDVFENEPHFKRGVSFSVVK